MGKYILTDGYVSVNGVDLSDHAFSIDTPDSKEQVDVSGFNSSGSKEYLPGQRDQEIVIQFLQDFAANKVHQTLQAIYAANSAVAIEVRPTSAGASSTNPKYSGTVQLYEYDGLNGQLNGRGEVTATFRPASGVTLAWATA